MTWAEWVESSYNTGGYCIGINSVESPSAMLIRSAKPNDIISDGVNYETYMMESGGVGN